MVPKIGFLAGAAGAMLYGTMITGAVVVYQEGSIRVSVHEKRADGTHISFIVPAAAVPVALGIVPREHLKDAARQIRPWVPAIQAASEALGRAADCTLVEVRDPHEHVLISKHGGAISIDVDDPEETVHVSFPVKMVASVARKLAASDFPTEEAAERNPPPAHTPGV